MQLYFSVYALSTCVKIAGDGRDAYMEKYGWLVRLEYQLQDGDVHVPESFVSFRFHFVSVSFPFY